MYTVFFKNLAIAATISGLFFSSYVYSATTADVVFLVDESGSMAGEHAWLEDVVTSLDSQLNFANVTNNRFAVIGFGGRTGHLEGHVHQDFNSALTTSSAFASLLTNGATEDGYSGIDSAFSLSFRGDAAANIILVTDEDRDILSGSTLTKDNILDRFLTKKTLLNAVVNSRFTDGALSPALGIDAKGNAYTADGSGGFTKATGGNSGSSSGTTESDYVDLAIQTQGAAWDLSQLREGGLTADSFTRAFIDTKVNEIIITNPVPLPAAFPLLASGLVSIGFFNRSRKKA